QTAEAAFDRLVELRDINRRRNTTDADSAAQPYAQVPTNADPLSSFAEAAAAVGPTVRPAIWARAYGDVEDRRAQQASFTVDGVNFATDLGYRQTMAGVMAGADAVISHFTSADDALVLGMLGASIDSNVNLQTSPVHQSFSGGTFGGYGTYLNGAWFADLMVKADLLS